MSEDEYERVMKRMDDLQKEGEEFADPIAHLDVEPLVVYCDRTPTPNGPACGKPAAWLGTCKACQEPRWVAVCGKCRDIMLTVMHPVQCTYCHWVGMAAVMFKWVQIPAERKPQ